LDSINLSKETLKKKITTDWNVVRDISEIGNIVKKKGEETPSSHGKEELLVTIVGSARMRSAPLSARRGEKERNKKIK
jgi:hypothetical protein